MRKKAKRGAYLIHSIFFEQATRESGLAPDVRLVQSFTSSVSREYTQKAFFQL